jgi:cyclopropane-fatty-acyl-phospholipid synthase
MPEFEDSARTGYETISPAPSPTGIGERMRSTELWLLQKMLQVLGNPPLRVVLWDGRELNPSNEPPVARIRINDRRALYHLIRNPELNFGNAYAEGGVEVEGDLVAVLETIYRAMMEAGDDQSPVSRLMSLLYQPRETPPNTLTRARENIHRHYDLGNDFYRLWLDREMVYTCAYFPTRESSLAEAQLAKMEHVCRKLRLQPGEHVVEAGCGWGALALHMARHHGVTVTAYNISSQQIAWARERARTENLQDRVEFIEKDYRQIDGTCDAFVSVGMLEHVGRAHYHALGEVSDRTLAPNGRGLIHSIGRDRPGTLNAWIERRIFTGAYAPTLREMITVLEPRGFSVLDVENLRLHYARTLHYWLQQYEAEFGRVEAMFDRNFARTWRLYLAGSEAAFTTGSLQLFQVTFTRSGENAIPWTRRYLYERPHARAEL